MTGVVITDAVITLTSATVGSSVGDPLAMPKSHCLVG
jgi:hypothetical protein